MSNLLPEAPLPVEVPIPVGTWVVLDDEARFLDRDFLTGGSPWRLLRLPGGARSVAQRWRDGDRVRVGEERFARTLVQQGLLHPVAPHPVHPDDVDVVVPVRDDVASLRALLARLDGLHVTVVDDASRNPVLIEECVRQFGADLVRLEVNGGPARARNAGAFATTRPFVWFIDVDVSLDNPLDVLHRLASQMFDPLVSASAPRIRGGAGTSARDRFERNFSPLDRGPRGGLVVPGGAIGFVPSACLLVRRAAFGEGFDESLRTGEDVDLVWRLHDRGWLVRYHAPVVVTHRARGNWRHWWNQRVGYGASSSELARRHGVRLAPLRADVWTLVAWSSALLGRPMIGARIVRVARDQLKSRVADRSDNPDEVANALVARGMMRAGLPLARAVVRTFGGVVLVAALHPRLRRRALVLFAVGTLARGQTSRLRPRDVPLAVADDLAYGVGVARGAWRARSLAAMRPHLTKSSIRVADVLGLRPRLRSGD
jgi:mycofactocin system glycosyltransferase